MTVSDIRGSALSSAVRGKKPTQIEIGLVTLLRDIQSWIRVVQISQCCVTARIRVSLVSAVRPMALTLGERKVEFTVRWPSKTLPTKVRSGRGAGL
jgi:hypothetical protein